MANTQRTLSQIIQNQGEIAGVEYLEERVKANDIEAIHLLVKYYVQRGSAKQKIDVIVELLEKGAELNDVRSSYLLGNIYSDGLFASPNIDLARQHYQRAAAAGHTKSQNKLTLLPESES